MDAAGKVSDTAKSAIGDVSAAGMDAAGKVSDTAKSAAD